MKGETQVPASILTWSWSWHRQAKGHVLKPPHQGPSPPQRTQMEQTALNDDRERNVLREGGVCAEDGP